MHLVHILVASTVVATKPHWGFPDEASDSYYQEYSWFPWLVGKQFNAEIMVGHNESFKSIVGQPHPLGNAW